MKEKLRNDAAKEGLVDPKKRSFFHDHIDVIVREDYVNSDSEHSDETPRKVNVASDSNSGLRQADSSHEGLSNVSPSKSATSASKASASTVKLPTITTKK